MTMKRLILTATVVVAAAGIAVVAIVNDARSSGVSSGVSAVGELPAPPTIPPDVGRWIEQSADATGTDEATARRNVRRLRMELGAEASELYAYESARGSVCFYLRGQVALCPERPAAGNRGIHWVTGGGYDDVPANLVAVVGDDVESVSLVSGSGQTTLPIVNNVIFTELDPAASAQLVVERKGGRSVTITVPAPAGT